MIRRLKVSGLLSFGPRGIDLPMEPLNVLIGPNGSGKSNLLEVLGLLRATPRELAGPIKQGGGVWEWLWKGNDSPGKATLEAVVNDSGEGATLRHALEFTNHGGLFEVTGERIEHAENGEIPTGAGFDYRLHQGHHTFGLAYGPEEEPASWPSDTLGIRLHHERSRPEESVLSQIRDAQTYPEMHRLQNQYERIRLYRNWSFGPEAEWRRNQSAHDRPDFLHEGGANLALVLSHFQGPVKRRLLKSLQELFDGIVDVNCPVTGERYPSFWRNGTDARFQRAVCPTAPCATSAFWPFCCTPSRRPWSPSRSRSWASIPMLSQRLRSCSSTPLSVCRS